MLRWVMPLHKVEQSLWHERDQSVTLPALPPGYPSAVPPSVVELGQVLNQSLVYVRSVRPNAGIPGWASAWWEEHALQPLAERQAHSRERRRCRRQLRRRRPLEVDSQYGNGIDTHLTCQQDPVDAWRPFTTRVRALKPFDLTVDSRCDTGVPAHLLCWHVPVEYRLFNARVWGSPEHYSISLQMSVLE